MSIISKLKWFFRNKRTAIHWLGVKKTFNDVLGAYPLDEDIIINGEKVEVHEGDAVFLTREHECDCCEGDYDSHWDQSVGVYTNPDHGIGNTRYKAVVVDGKWTRVKIPWRNY